MFCSWTDGMVRGVFMESLQPAVPVLVCEGLAVAHFVDVGLWVEIIAFDEFEIELLCYELGD